MFGFQPFDFEERTLAFPTIIKISLSVRRPNFDIALSITG